MLFSIDSLPTITLASPFNIFIYKNIFCNKKFKKIFKEMLRNFIKINLLLLIIITKNYGVDPGKDTIEYFLRESGALNSPNQQVFL